VEHLERDRPVMAKVVREVNRRHATTAELSLDAVAVSEAGLEVGRMVGQGATSPW